MAKRHKKIKRSKSEQLEIDLNRWLGKKNDAIELLIKSMAKLKELGRAGVRLEKNEQRKRVEKKRTVREQTAIANALKDAHAVLKDVTNVPVSELPIADVVRKPRKRKADATVQGSA